MAAQSDFGFQLDGAKKEFVTFGDRFLDLQGAGTVAVYKQYDWDVHALSSGQQVRPECVISLLFRRGRMASYAMRRAVVIGSCQSLKYKFLLFESVSFFARDDFRMKLSVTEIEFTDFLAAGFIFADFFGDDIACTGQSG